MGNSKFLTALKKAAEVAGDVLSSKGDILTRTSSALARLAVGSNFKVLMATSGESTGLAWSPSSTSVLTTAGDLLYASSANTLARLAKGTDNQILKMNGSAINWETAPTVGGTFEVLDDHDNTAVSTYTFTPSSALTWDNYEYFILMAEFISSGAGNMLLTFNSALTQGWSYSGREITTAPAETLVGATGQSTIEVGNFGGSGERTNVYIMIRKGANDNPVSFIDSVCTNQDLEQRMSGTNTGAAGTGANFTNITISNSNGAGWNALGTIKVLGLTT
tara:strand:- start:638 stop:1468 length:831 start_codon:yes stop_codon:yes gene_type:complete